METLQSPTQRTPWNKGRLIGHKLPLLKCGLNPSMQHMR
jgi:hypothetical protein